MNNSDRLKKLLIRHYRIYPKARLVDIVKFIYQNQFGPGHFIASETESLDRLKIEFRTLHNLHSKGKLPFLQEKVFETLGNGLCRLHLFPLHGMPITSQTINRLFLSTAEKSGGSLMALEQSLDVIRECCNKGLLPYGPQEEETFLTKYKNQGYPLVRHSPEFRLAYAPAYRIVKAEYEKFFKLFCRIDALLKKKTNITLAIDGNSGAGKTWLAGLLANVYDVNVFHMDDFFLQPHQRTSQRLQEIGGNVDYVRFKEEIIEGLKQKAGFVYAKYDCMAEKFVEQVQVKPKLINVVEGVYSMHPTLIDYYDLKVFMHISPQKQSRRILNRNGPIMHRRFIEEWIPMEEGYFTDMGIMDKADLVFLN